MTCPTCSGPVYERVVDGKVLTFHADTHIEQCEDYR